MVSCQVLPAGYGYQKALADSIKAASEFAPADALAPQKELLSDLAGKIGCIQAGLAGLKDALAKAGDVEDALAAAEFYCNTVKSKMDA